MSELSREALALLRRIGGLEELEVLLLLARSSDRAMTAPQIAAALRVVLPLESALEKLAHENLVDVKLGSDVLYKFMPTEENKRLVAIIATEYDQRRLAVIRALAESSPARDFAEAFRIRKKRGTDG